MTLETWTTERVDQLRNYVDAGLTCSQIAAEIGVSRNAVIGKIHRLGLSPGRPAAALARPCPQRGQRPRLPSHRQMLRLISVETPFVAADAAAVPIESAHRCSLLELAQDRCRWPLGDPVSSSGAVDFAFCGNETVRGLSYCAGHARMAYRPTSRRRA
jgi:GcrA cell cycle regulator